MVALAAVLVPEKNVIELALSAMAALPAELEPSKLALPIALLTMEAFAAVLEFWKTRLALNGSDGLESLKPLLVKVGTLEELLTIPVPVISRVCRFPKVN